PRRLRALARRVRTRRRALSPLRRAARGDSRHRRTDHGTVRRLSKVKKLLLTPKTPDELVAEMRTHVRATAKDRPGVYRWLSADGEVVYVGKSKKLRTRLLSYFRCGSEEKGARIVREATRVEWEYTPSEFAALLEELRLIKRFRPRLNVAMKRDARHFAFIK